MIRCITLTTIFFLSACFFPRITVHAQSIRTIEPGNQPDSSYYDIARIDHNEFWVGGENGVLKCLDTLGNVSTLRMPGPTRHILKIVPAGRYVYIAADQGTIFRYDRARDTWIHSDYGKQGFDKLTFYDLVVLTDGSLVVAGGNHRVAKKGKIAIPRGFIAKIDAELLQAPEFVWKHALQFTFSLAYDETKNEVYAVAFNGVNSQLFSSIDDAHTFQRQGSLPGLVHHIRLHDGEMWYAGAKGIRYSHNGLVGKRGDSPLALPGDGCIWGLLPLGDQMYLLAYNGAIISPNATLTNYDFKVRAATSSLYEAAPISNRKAFIVGHGRRILLLELHPEEDGTNLRVRNDR